MKEDNGRKRDEIMEEREDNGRKRDEVWKIIFIKQRKLFSKMFQ